ncbi:MAG: chorismate synthase [Helicobacter sp.]|nr:chorismate synthase [Helicobacter sp.]
MDNFGRLFGFQSFGESHGEAIGCVIYGMPSGIKIDLKLIESELLRRRGDGRFSTKRIELDEFNILSGVFNGLSTGTPIGITIPNTNTRSADYDEIKDLFRPGHADFTYFHKYGLRDYRGGGRSSARESVARVIAGAFAKMLLNELDIKISSGILSVGEIKASEIDFDFAKKSSIFALDKAKENAQKELILELRKNGNSIGSSVLLKAKGVPIGLGEGLYDKLDARLGAALLGLNGVKAISIGSGTHASEKTGFENNDQMNENGFISNNAGGILGGLSNGNDLEITVHFKPTSSIKIPQKTQKIDGSVTEFITKGRHDPCIGIRGSVVCESMLAIVLCDFLLLNMSTKAQHIINFYKNANHSHLI